jgi:hypothetical protein
MEYASSTLPGIVSTTGQQFGGFKQFSAITAPFVDGSNNVLYGAGALSSITSGTGNTAVGYNALGLNTTGSNNIAFGVQALSNNIGGSNNIALGDETLRSNINGNNNVGIGASSLSGNIGNNNLGIGMNAGFDLTNGDNNIIIGTNVSGTGAQADSIQIGAQGTQTSCAIAGIAGTIITNASPVLINITTGQLGSIVSAKKYKENIKNITTTDLLKLRPVTFTYIGDEKLKKQVGLIADEVNDIMPFLVLKNHQQEIETLKYQDLSVLMLQQLINQQERLEEEKDILTNIHNRLTLLEQSC